LLALAYATNTPNPLFKPYSPGCREGKFSETGGCCVGRKEGPELLHPGPYSLLPAVSTRGAHPLFKKLPPVGYIPSPIRAPAPALPPPPIAPVPITLRLRLIVVVMVPIVMSIVLGKGGGGGRHHHRHHNDYRKNQAETSHRRNLLSSQRSPLRDRCFFLRNRRQH
jgi:hypothetical protein